jgi:hypothetical protein
MSSDSFADLGASLRKVAEGVTRLVDQNKRPAVGSPADKEADGEPFAGEWGRHPGRDVVATLLMECWSCADHLKVAGTVLAGHLGVASLYTLTRGGAEAAVIGCYLSDPEIDPLERVRRLMNHNLSALQEDLNMLSRLPGEDAAARAARHRAQEEAIERTARQFGLPFQRPKKSFSPCCLGAKAPSAMALIDKYALPVPGAGAYQQLLSSVAHGQLHGLSRFLMRAPAPAEPGKVIIQMNLTDRDAAVHLMPGPLCASTLVEHLRWYLGWDTEDLDPDVIAMLHVWGRLAGVPYPGPEQPQPGEALRR